MSKGGLAILILFVDFQQRAESNELQVEHIHSSAGSVGTVRWEGLFTALHGIDNMMLAIIKAGAKHRRNCQSLKATATGSTRTVKTQQEHF